MTAAAIVQNRYVVADLEAACRRFYQVYGIGPFEGSTVDRMYAAARTAAVWGGAALIVRWPSPWA